jgi:CMP-N,N'-diacetyllegionaminic acid synthase
MINEKMVLAVIPARAGSKGLPGKNILNLGGKPLIGWPISAAKKSKYIDRVILSTDEPQIGEIAKKYGAEVPFIRPPELSLDTSTSISVLEHAIDFVKKEGVTCDYCLLLEATSPLTETKDIDDAIEKLEANREIADSIVGISKSEAGHPSFSVVLSDSGLLAPYETDGFSQVKRRQEIKDVFFLEGSLYLSDTSVLLKQKGFYHQRTLPFIVPKWKAFEVDDMVDFICIEAILNNLKTIKNSQNN